MNGADQDSVRLLAVEDCAAVGKLLDRQECIATVLPFIITFAQVRDRTATWHSDTS